MCCYVCCVRSTSVVGAGALLGGYESTRFKTKKSPTASKLDTLHVSQAGRGGRTCSEHQGSACSLPYLLPQSALGSVNTRREGCGVQLLCAADHTQPNVHLGTTHCTPPVHPTGSRCTVTPPCFHR